jgi:hypothetical protein
VLQKNLICYCCTCSFLQILGADGVSGLDGVSGADGAPGKFAKTLSSPGFSFYTFELVNTIIQYNNFCFRL